MATMIQVRVDDELKSKAEELFKDLGTDTTTAIRMFLTQAAADFSKELRSKYGLLLKERMVSEWVAENYVKNI